MSNRLQAGLTIVLLSCAGALAAADAERPAQHRPISTIVASAGHGDDVVLRGHVQEHAGIARYVLADATGELIVQIPRALLTGGITLLAGTAVEIHGRVAFAPGHAAHIEAHKVIVLRAADAPLGAVSVQIK